MYPYYTINKGTGKQVEFKGLRAQHLTHLAIIFMSSFLVFAILHIIGIPSAICIAVVGTIALGASRYVIRVNRIYGQHGLAKMQAARVIPDFILQRKSFGNLLKKNTNEKHHTNIHP